VPEKQRGFLLNQEMIIHCYSMIVYSFMWCMDASIGYLSL